MQLYQRVDTFLTLRIAEGQLVEHRRVAQFSQCLSGLKPFLFTGRFTADRHTLIFPDQHILAAPQPSTNTDMAPLPK